MIISVASGKGGTGKTTVSTNMALSLDKNVQLLDCDVEEPNAHIFLKPEIDRTESVYVPIPEVNKNACSYCKKCMEICRFNAITVVGDNVLIFPELCHSCGGCLEICPEGAISETGRKLGVMEFGHHDGLEFIHGLMRIGEAMSPPLIKKVRNETNPEKITIIDAPPGTSCPVIAAMNGADFVLMVTEPTPFGLHDLELAVEAVKLLNIPSGLVINRSDIGDRKVYEYAASQQLPILMEIPFDREIAEIYSQGKSIVAEKPEWKIKFRQLYDAIEALVEKNGRKFQ